MNILQIIPTLGSGGAEHFVVELSNELCLQGHCVEILTLFPLSKDNHLCNVLDSRIKLSSFEKKKGLWLRGFIKVKRYIINNHYDVVHGHVGAIKYLILATFLCRKVQFVATIHSEAKREAGKSVDRWSRKIMFGLKKCIPVTISGESERSFEEFYGRKGVMIFNGVSNYVKKETIQLRDNEDEIVFIHPSSCQPVKNQQLLLSAFCRLINNGYNAKLVWVGNNTSYANLFYSLKPLMEKNVSFLGVVDNVRDYMVASDAMCLSSKMEGMPMTIIEAFSVGCPVLCTPVGGCVNMIKRGENGMLSDDLTEESYYKILESFVLLSKEERATMSANAASSFVNYCIEKCANHYLQVYRKATK